MYVRGIADHWANEKDEIVVEDRVAKCQTPTLAKRFSTEQEANDFISQWEGKNITKNDCVVCPLI